MHVTLFNDIFGILNKNKITFLTLRPCFFKPLMKQPCTKKLKKQSAFTLKISYSRIKKKYKVNYAYFKKFKRKYCMCMSHY
jgi:stage III sporulation protein SpoIIIAA